MRTLTRLATGLAFASALTGAGLLWATTAAADTDRTDCMGGSCVRVHCFEDGTCERTSFDERYAYRDPYDVASYAPALKPLRFACDQDGDNCHTTRSYYLDDEGTPIYDPDASPYR